MNMTLGEMVAWGVIGLLAGSLAGLVVKRKAEGFGWITNLIFGLIGAFIGGVVFDKLDINLGLGKVTVDLNTLVAAFCGAIIVVALAAFIQGRRNSSN